MYEIYTRIKQRLIEMLQHFIKLFQSTRCDFITSIQAKYSCESVHDFISDVTKFLDPSGHVMKALSWATSLASVVTERDCKQNVILDTNCVAWQKKLRRSEQNSSSIKNDIKKWRALSHSFDTECLAEWDDFSFYSCEKRFRKHERALPSLWYKKLIWSIICWTEWERRKSIITVLEENETWFSYGKRVIISRALLMIR